MRPGTMVAALGALLGACSSCGSGQGCQGRDPVVDAHRLEIALVHHLSGDESGDELSYDDPRISEVRQEAFDLLGGRHEIYVEIEGDWFVAKIRPPKVPPPTFEELRCPGGMAKIPGRDEPPLAPFCMSKTMVTVVEYRSCVEAGRCTEPGPGKRHRSYDDPSCTNCPVNYVDDEQAAMYCTWIGSLVPTEEEWLWAYGSAQNIRFPWGEHIPQGLDVCRGDIGTRTPSLCVAGAFDQDQTRQGIFDMAGGLDELVRVGNSALPWKRVMKREFPDTTSGPVLSEEWLSLHDVREADGTAEGFLFPSVTNGLADVGFRCVTRGVAG